MQKINLLHLLVLLLMLTSCSSRLEKYESNWIVVACEVDGVNFIDEFINLNFEIDVHSMSSYPPSSRNRTYEDRQKPTSAIRFFRMDGKDFMEVLDHYYFTGIYEIRCLDEDCCTIQLQSEHVQMELDYNGELPFGWSRNCPAARF